MRTTDRAMSSQEFLYWYCYLTGGPMHELSTASPEASERLMDEFIAHVKKDPGRVISYDPKRA